MNLESMYVFTGEEVIKDDFLQELNNNFSKNSSNLLNISESIKDSTIKTVNNKGKDANNNINVTELIPSYLTSDTDLNNIVVSGEYSYSVGDATITNSPTANSFFLTVLKNNNSIKQVVTEVVSDDPITFTRVKIGDSWSPWVEGGKVKTINSIKPDDSGNVDLATMDYAVNYDIGMWKPSEEVSLGDVRYINGRENAGVILECIQAGITGSTPPDVSGEGMGLIADLENSLVDYSYNNLVIANTPNFYKRANLFIPNKTKITVPKHTQVRIGNKGYQNLTDVTLDLSQAGSVDARKGKDVYLYACQPTDNSSEPVFVLSLNSTVPTGYTAENSRKIGGMHCLCANVGTISGHALSGYSAGDVLPLSVWDLLHRPVSNPEGMVWIAGLGLWVDIYLPSWSGSQFTSAYGAVISDGASSPSFNGEKFVEYAGLIGKRPCYRNEFMVFAKGSNENTNIAGSSDPNTTGGHTDTAGRRMISNYGIEDCCGVLWQWGADLFENYPGSTWNSSNFYLDGYAWQNKSVYNSTYDSQTYGSCAGLLRRVRLGAAWGDGSVCGSRSAACSSFSAEGWSYDSSRLVAEPMVVNL